MKQSIKVILISIFMISILFGQTYIIDESFGTVPPDGWTNGTTPPTWEETIGYDDSYSLHFQEDKNNAVSIVTPSVTDPDRITFYHQTDNANAYTGTFEINYSTSSSGPWNNITTITTSSQNGFTFSATELSDIESGPLPGTYYFQLIRTSTNNRKELYIDVFQVTQSLVRSTNSLSGFITEPETSSPEQSFTVSGADLTADITLTAPTNYEISTSSGSGFGSSVTLTQSGGTVASTTIYARLKSGLSSGTYNEDITITSTGKISKTVACSGDVRQSINPSTASLTGFNYEPSNGPSAEQSFTVSGQDLTADITLTPPTNYEISTTSGSGFGSSLTLTESGGTVTSTTIYVRLKAGLSEGSYNDENITISSTGKVSRTVTCSGEVQYGINLSTNSLLGFIAEPDAPSSEQSFTVSGQDLTADITLTPPTNYEISTASGSGFGSSLTLTQSGGTVASTTIYVRLKAGLPEGSYNSEDITISSTGKISKMVSCSGDVRQSINPSTSSLSNFSYDPGYGPSAEQSFTVSGQDLTADITLTPPTNYEISTGSGAGFSATNPITLNQSGGTVASTTIYVRLKAGLSEGTYNDENITISSTGKVSRTVTCSGFVRPIILNIKVFLEGGL